MTDDVAAHVLRDNYEQNVLLGNARAQEHSMASVHARLIHWLEDRGDLDRALEFLPTDAEIEKRAHDGLGLKSPEFSVLVAYAKLALKEDILASSIPDDPYFERTLAEYFPPQIREDYRDELAGHPLRREIVTNAVVNSMVNRGGITFAFRAQEEAGATPEQVTRAFVVCREVFGLADYVREVEALDNVVPTAAQTALYLEFRRLLDRSVRWFLTSRPSTLDIGAEIERFSGIVRDLRTQVPTLLRGEEKRRLERKAAELTKAGVPEDLAVRAASLLDWYSLLDIVDIATDTGRRADRRRPAVLPGLGAVRHRRDARQGHPTAARRPVGRPGPWRAARRPLLGAGVADPLGHRGRCGRRRARGPVGGVGEGEQGLGAAQQDGAVGHPPPRQPQHRRAVGGAAHAAIRHPGRRQQLTRACPRIRPIGHWRVRPARTRIDQ